MKCSYKTPSKTINKCYHKGQCNQHWSNGNKWSTFKMSDPSHYKLPNSQNTSVANNTKITSNKQYKTFELHYRQTMTPTLITESTLPLCHTSKPATSHHMTLPTTKSSICSSNHKNIHKFINIVQQQTKLMHIHQQHHQNTTYQKQYLSKRRQIDIVTTL